jgi:hypothetical protein
VIRLSLPNETLFEQGLSNKLNNSLVIKNKSKPKQSIKQPTSAIPPATSAASVAPSKEKHGGQDDSILSVKLIRIAPETSSF